MVHGVLEQDGTENSLASEAGAGHDPRAHLMHQSKHLSLIGPRIFLDSIRTERLGRTATTLIQRRNETGICRHFLKLLRVVTHCRSPKIFLEMKGTCISVQGVVRVGSGGFPNPPVLLLH